MQESIKIALIPLDNRPVSYSLPVQIGQLNNNVKVLVPPRELIGDLEHNTNVDKVLLWLNDTLINNKIDIIVCNLDTIAYGGLIPSRRSPDTEAMILARLSDLEIMIGKHKEEHNTKIYAFSSIMRISNNNINEEEKEYWNKYGELIFQYSYLSHKNLESKQESDVKDLDIVGAKIPDDILKDYLSTRERNFKINKYYLSWIENGFIDFLVYSQDDTSKYGFNVIEASTLKQLIADKNLSSNVTVQTGADEIPCDLLIRGIVDKLNANIRINPVFSVFNGKNIISRYEDRSISESVKGQINLCGAKVTTDARRPDLVLLVHTPCKVQNDHAMKIYSEPENEIAVARCLDIIKGVSRPLILADVAYANGADNLLINKILAEGVDINKIYSYAGWNTTSNTLGSAIAIGISRYLAEKSGSFNPNEFKKLLLIRLSDDWAYQTVVRQKIRALTQEADKVILNEELKPLVINIAKKIDLPLASIKLSFPWNRTFEVEIDVTCK